MNPLDTSSSFVLIYFSLSVHIISYTRLRECVYTTSVHLILYGYTSYYCSFS